MEWEAVYSTCKCGERRWVRLMETREKRDRIAIACRREEKKGQIDVCQPTAGFGDLR